MAKDYLSSPLREREGRRKKGGTLTHSLLSLSQITISDELASLLTEAAVLLAEYPNDERLETVKELVSRSKATVFYHLVQYWVEFSEFYKSLPSSPAHSSTCK